MEEIPRYLSLMKLLDTLIVVSANLRDIMNINIKNNPSLIITAERCFWRADEGVTPKASQIFVSFFLPKATFGSYERRVIFYIYIYKLLDNRISLMGELSDSMVGHVGGGSEIH